LEGGEDDMRTSIPPRKPARAPRRTPADDQRITIHGVTFEQYEAVRETLDDVPGLRLTYLEGTLEIMSPGRRHELGKKVIARLVELYATECGIELEGYGSMTFKKKAEESGLEPDECYCLGEMGEGDREIPDIALEVVVTSDGVSKLDVYEGLGVREVWFFEGGRFSIHGLGKRGYEPRERSTFLPDLDFRLLERIIATTRSQPEAARMLLEHLRGSPTARRRSGGGSVASTPLTKFL
jgi:Uma2 family endonuclease